MISRIDIMTGGGNAIICRKSYMYEFPHDYGNLRNASQVPDEITTKLHW